MDSLREMLDKVKKRRLEDAQRFADADSDLCMCCHAYGEDKRSLWIDCFYEIREVIPDAIEIFEVKPPPNNHQSGYYLRICKTCRGRLLSMLNEWWADGVRRRDILKNNDGEEEELDLKRNIPVRINGTIVMLTQEEWDERQTPTP